VELDKGMNVELVNKEFRTKYHFLCPLSAFFHIRILEGDEGHLKGWYENIMVNPRFTTHTGAFCRFIYGGKEGMANAECGLGNEEFNNNIRFYVRFWPLAVIPL